MVYLVLIWLNPGQAETLRAYERLAVPIMRAHGGDLERVFQPDGEQPADAPDEVHLLRFADPGGLAGFRADPALQAGAALRAAAVRAAQFLPLREWNVDDYLAG
ncbi:MAG TPA: hypothetical protein VD886_22845 [Herpetosiphonaceae bacterium]|nr:hypothetical protein [Herpetosiphonaceae bacterium]